MKEQLDPTRDPIINPYYFMCFLFFISWLYFIMSLTCSSEFKPIMYPVSSVRSVVCIVNFV